jgi:hypothetical protein
MKALGPTRTLKKAMNRRDDVIAGKNIKGAMT